MTYNVALIVLDTLREDYAQGLEALRERGFIRYKNAIAPAPWTLPSHASILTGLYPSEHGVHHTEETVQHGLRLLARRSRLLLHKLGYGIIGEFARNGYRTYILTSNPFVSPIFGFRADESFIIDSVGKKEVSEIIGDSKMETIFTYLKKRKVIDLVNVTSRALRWKIKTFIDPKDKGGRNIYNFLRRINLREPYFLLVNLSEAHGPYTRRELITSIYQRCYFKTIMNDRCPVECEYIRQVYPSHAHNAVSLALKIIEYIDDGKTVIVVSSDHGEGLCDPGFGHGYWLSDPLIRVPLWIKVPQPANVLVKGKYFPLTQIPELLRYAYTGRAKIGSDEARSEADAFCNYVEIERLIGRYAVSALRRKCGYMKYRVIR